MKMNVQDFGKKLLGDRKLGMWDLQRKRKIVKVGRQIHGK